MKKATIKGDGKMKLKGIKTTNLPQRPLPPTMQKLLTALQSASDSEIFYWEDVCNAYGIPLGSARRYLRYKQFAPHRLQLYRHLYLGSEKAIADSKERLKARGEPYED